MPERHGALQLPGIRARLSAQVGRGAIAQRWLLQPLSSASESASWGSSPTAARESPVRQDQKAWRLPRGAVEPGGACPPWAPSPTGGPLGPGPAWARGRGNPAKHKSVSAPVAQRGRQPHLCPGSVPLGLSVSGCWRCLWESRARSTQVTVSPASVLHCSLLCQALSLRSGG